MTWRHGQSAVDAALRGYFVHRGKRDDPALHAYYLRARELGRLFLILREWRTCASLTWNGDAVEDRARWELYSFGDRQAAPGARHYPYRLQTKELGQLLEPFLLEARRRPAELLCGGYYGGVYRINHEDGVAAAEIARDWFQARLPGPETREAFWRRVDAAPAADQTDG